MSLLPYRLGSSSLFVRTNEDSVEPKRVVFLSVEGTKTEVQYLHFIEQYREQLGINAIVHIEVLRRYDTKSDPENVLELLEEYIEFRENKMFEKIIDSLRLKNYSTEFIKSYLKNPSALTKKECNKFEVAMREEQLDFLYLDFLSKYQGKDDKFGIVIDRDCGSHSPKQMKNVVRKCKEKRNLTDDEAIVVMVDSNLQREKILPSEKAFAYKMKLEAMKRQQGCRSDLTSATPLQKLGKKSSRELLAEQVGESHEQIRKYIRLTNLIPEILEKVDDDKIGMRPAVELSYLSKEEQELLYDAMESEACTPSHDQAIRMRNLSKEGKLTEDIIMVIMSQEKPNQVEQWKIPKSKLKKYFPSGTSQEKIEETIIKALELYRKREKTRER